MTKQKWWYIVEKVVELGLGLLTTDIPNQDDTCKIHVYSLFSNPYILKTKSNFTVFITEYFYSCFDLIKDFPE